MKLLTSLAVVATAAFTTVAFAGEPPDLDGKEVIVVTENAYPPLQFVDPASGEAIGWGYDAMAGIAKRINITVVYENIGWDDDPCGFRKPV
ncbi:MAG: transporter substrate-binding domain-containing protein [Marinosulfonomonas sp.]|nr:transporter substrate-binding domain-containing protein [Marinosulfonomonas sp.]